MLSFKKREGLLEKELSLNKEEISYLNELLDSSEEMNDEDLEFSYDVYGFCLIIRIFELGRYSFVFPIALSERGELEMALEACLEYSAKEEIPKIFEDVPKNSLPFFFKKLRHLNVDFADVDGEIFKVEVKSECELLEKIPSISIGEITLSEITDENAAEYARLSRDEAVNKYWGYDYREDYGEVKDDSFFLQLSRNEFARGVAISLAIMHRGKFSGEAVLYSFLGDGTAELAIRLLPEAMGKGIASLAMIALKELARMIGLIRLYAFVDKRNKKSLIYIAKHMQKEAETPDRVKFYTDLY